MQSQATTVSALDGEKSLSSLMSVSVCSVGDELHRMYQVQDIPAPVFESSLQRPVYVVTDGHVALGNSSEIAYTAPQNTTLIEVLGPTGSNPNWVGDAECYAFLNPRPVWWRTSEFPLSTSRKAVAANNQTMFLLPVDPAIQYEVRVGGLGRENTCPVSAFRSYPLH